MCEWESRSTVWSDQAIGWWCSGGRHTEFETNSTLFHFVHRVSLSAALDRVLGGRAVRREAHEGESEEAHVSRSRTVNCHRSPADILQMPVGGLAFACRSCRRPGRSSENEFWNEIWNELWNEFQNKSGAAEWAVLRNCHLTRLFVKNAFHSLWESLLNNRGQVKRRCVAGHWSDWTPLEIRTSNLEGKLNLFGSSFTKLNLSGSDATHFGLQTLEC